MKASQYFARVYLRAGLLMKATDWTRVSMAPMTRMLFQWVEVTLVAAEWNKTVTLSISMMPMMTNKLKMFK